MLTLLASSANAAFEPGNIIDATEVALFDTEEGLFGGIMPLLTGFFGIVAVLAILVTGFFKGRAWVKRV